MSVIKMTDLDLAGKRVLIRADLNVPVKDGKVTSTHVFVLLYRPSNGPKTRRKSDGNFPPRSSYRRRVQRRVLSTTSC